MASVRGTDPRLVAESDPDCVTTNQDRDTTYVGTGPDQTERKMKDKEKTGVLIRPILGRERTRDPDPGHVGPDFDSGSGHRSAFTDPGSGCLPESTTFLRTFWIQTDFYGLFLDLNFTLKRYARWRF
jgi:hypothetical protein